MKKQLDDKNNNGYLKSICDAYSRELLTEQSVLRFVKKNFLDHIIKENIIKQVSYIDPKH